MNKTGQLLKRDLKNSFNMKAVYLLVFMLLLQSWFILCSGSIKDVAQNGEVSFMNIVFSYNLFGSIAALGLTYDLISKERESKMLDLILTSDICKKQVLLSKIICCFVIFIIFSMMYIIVIFVEYLFFTRNISISILCFRYVFPVAIFLSIYAVMGLMLSITFRSSRASLIVSVIIGGLFMPRIFTMATEGMGNALNLSKSAVDVINMLSPALIMNELSKFQSQKMSLLAMGIFLLYMVIMIVLSIIRFSMQDELNYDE